MKLAVVDDEKEYTDKIIRYCGEFGAEKKFRLEPAGFESGSDFLKNFEKEHYSIVFMDIYLEGLNGIEVSRRLRTRDSGCLLIFLTSSADFMADAFSCHAFEYITKPFTKERVFQVLGDALKILSPKRSYIQIVNGRSPVPVALSDILSVVSDGHYLEISLTDGTMLRSRMTAAEFLGLADHDPRFLSVNRGIILNADHISKIENLCCTLVNGSKFPIRVRNSLQVAHALQEYNFEKLRSMQRHTFD